MSVSEKKVTVGKFEWFYREAEPIGRSDLVPVVLLHGIVAHSYSWRNILPALAQQGSRAIAPDWLGFGFSSKPDKRDFSYTPDAFVDGLADFINALELEKISLVVQGFLGSVGLQYALRNPEKIVNIAILGSPISTDAKLPWKIQQMGLPLAGDMMTQDPLLVDRTLEGGARYVIPEEDLMVYRKPYLTSSASGRSLLATIRNLDLGTVTQEITTGFQTWENPVLLQWGVNDPWLSIEMADSFLKTLKNGDIIRIQNVAHYPQEHYHETILEDLLPFVRCS